MSFRVLIYNSYSDLTLLDDLINLTSLRYTTGLHGGFRQATVEVPMELGRAWLYLAREQFPGRHFKHMVIYEGRELRWEGRIMEAGIAWSGANQSLRLTAMGYWSSMRDQRVATVNYSGGTNTVDSIIKTTLTAECPDISSDQSNIDTVAGNVNMTLDVDTFTADHIVNALAPLGDSSDNTYYFAVWENRLPYYNARSVAEIDWEVPLSSIRNGEITQSALQLRNAADAYDGSSRTASAANTDSQVLYPVRDQVVSVPSGTTSGRAEDARDRFLSERKDPQQSSRFTISGQMFRKASNRSDAGQRSAVRAGHVMRIIGLTGSAASISLDNVRTFFILETAYDALRDEVNVTPDKPPSSLSILLARQGVETKR